MLRLFFLLYHMATSWNLFLPLFYSFFRFPLAQQSGEYVVGAGHCSFQKINKIRMTNSWALIRTYSLCILFVSFDSQLLRHGYYFTTNVRKIVQLINFSLSFGFIAAHLSYSTTPTRTSWGEFGNLHMQVVAPVLVVFFFDTLPYTYQAFCISKQSHTFLVVLHYYQEYRYPDDKI